MTLFREPGSNKVSMTRVCAFILAIDATLLAIVAARYILAPSPQATVLAAITGLVGAFVAAGCVALLSRTKGEPTA